MSIFSKIRDAIFNRKPAASAGTATAGTTGAAGAPAAANTTAGGAPGATGGARTAATATGDAAGNAGTAMPATAAPAPAALQQVDVEAVLTQMSSSAGQKLNWRTSIVDLMKLLGMESSLEERRELAKELGYTGSTSDTATMNVWLHKQVMKKLAENGGKVPASMLD